MNFRSTAGLVGAALIFCSCPAWTQVADDDDAATATIRLMSNAEAELPEAVTKEIKLPENLTKDTKAVEKSAKGLATANKKRLEGNQGLDQAMEAQQRSAEMAESAKEKQENRGRSENLPEPPNRPEPRSQ